MRYMMHKYLFVSFCLFLISGCMDEFSSASIVEGLRVLAIKGEPPALALGEETGISALIVTPDDSPAVTSWELCIYTLDEDSLRTCPEDAILQRGDGDTFSIVYDQQMYEKISPFCNPTGALGNTIPDGAELPDCDEDGLQITVRIRTTGYNDSIVAVKTLHFLMDSTETRNKNPVISNISGQATVRPGQKYTISCPIDENSVETVIEGETSEEEKIRYRWYMVGGDITATGSGGNGGGMGAPSRDKEMADDEAEIEIDDDATVARIWCVVADERGGVDWRRMDFTVR